MKFKQYLYEYKDNKGFFQSLDEEEFKELALGKFKKSLELYKNAKTKVFRGIKSAQRQSFGYYPKREEQRMSENTGNLYTLMINNSPIWKAYPHRNVICSTSAVSADSYGSCYVVLPMPKTKVGVCPDNDIWDSFDYLQEKTTLWLNDINGAVAKILSTIHYDNFATPEEKKFHSSNSISNIKSYTSLKKLFSLIDKYKDEMSDEIRNAQLEMWLEDDADFFTFIDDLLDPRKNDFELYTFESLTKTELQGVREVWFNDEALLVYDRQIDKVIKDLGI